jgi:hypothetical protein
MKYINHQLHLLNHLANLRDIEQHRTNNVRTAAKIKKRLFSVQHFYNFLIS